MSASQTIINNAIFYTQQNIEFLKRRVSKYEAEASSPHAETYKLMATLAGSETLKKICLAIATPRDSTKEKEFLRTVEDDINELAEWKLLLGKLLQEKSALLTQVSASDRS